MSDRDQIGITDHLHRNQHSPVSTVPFICEIIKILVDGKGKPFQMANGKWQRANGKRQKVKSRKQKQW
jgi:hypothetical protein